MGRGANSCLVTAPAGPRSEAVRFLPFAMQLFEMVTGSGHYHIGYRQPEDTELVQSLERMVLMRRAFIDPLRPVLDVGSGMGGALLTLRRLGYRAYGVEPDAGAVDYARQLLGGSARAARFVLRGRIEEIDPAQLPTFGTILISEVSHHTASLEDFLRPCRVLLERTGCIVLNDLFLVEDTVRVPYHSLGNFDEAVRRSGLRVFTRASIRNGGLCALRALIAEARRLRSGIVTELVTARPSIREEYALWLRQLRALERALSQGELAYESIVLRKAA